MPSGPRTSRSAQTHESPLKVRGPMTPRLSRLEFRRLVAPGHVLGGGEDRTHRQDEILWRARGDAAALQHLAAFGGDDPAARALVDHAVERQAAGDARAQLARGTARLELLQHRALVDRDEPTTHPTASASCVAPFNAAPRSAVLWTRCDVGCVRLVVDHRCMVKLPMINHNTNQSTACAERRTGGAIRIPSLRRQGDA